MNPLEYNFDLRRYARSLTGKADNRDLIQTTYLKAYEHLDRFDGRNLKAWLFTIMKNEYINQVRKPSKVRTIETPAEIICYSLPCRENFLSLIFAKDIEREIEANLTDMAKHTFWMRFEGYNEKEIGEHLNVPHSTIRSRIFNAKAKLMKRIER